jgi:hypothetical protein
MSVYCSRPRPPWRRCQRRRCLAAIVLFSVGGAHSALAQASTVDVWIDLTEPVPGAGGDRVQARRQRDRVLRQQEAVAALLQQLHASELARVRHTGNAIAVRIDPAALDAVRAWPDVRRVRPVVKLHPPRPAVTR